MFCLRRLSFINKIITNIQSLQENSLRPSKEKNCEVQDKKPATLLNIYYFIIIFQGISLRLKRSSRSQMYFKIGVLKSRPVGLLKRDSNTGAFSVNTAKFLQTTFFTEHIRWLLLNFLDHIFYRAPLVAACVFSNSLGLFKKTGLIYTMLSKKYLYI